MRLFAALALVVVGCSNDVDPRVIAGGGVGDGEIDGEINVAVIDNDTDAPIAGATVDVKGNQKTTDAKGFVTFTDVEGAQNVTVKITGYRSAVWMGVNGANVTIPLTANGTTSVPQATLSGSLAGWDAITVPAGHAKAAFVTYSQTDDLGNAANSIPQNNGNVCIAGTTCNWTVISRTGTVTLIALIIDRDLNGTLTDPSDDTQKVIGYAYKPGLTVSAGVNQSGLVLDQIQAGDLDTVTVDKGTPPASLTEFGAVVGIEIGKHEVIQLPLAVETPTPTSIIVPKRTVFGSATYRLTAISQTTSGDMGAQSVVLRQGLTTTALAAGTWLVPPAGVTATRTNAAWEPVAGAKAHSATWKDTTGDLLEITAFNAQIKQVDVPTLVALPSSGTLTARVSAIGADFDVNDFSLEDDSALLWGISAQPVNLP